MDNLKNFQKFPRKIWKTLEFVKNLRRTSIGSFEENPNGRRTQTSALKRTDGDQKSARNLLEGNDLPCRYLNDFTCHFL